MKYICEVSNNIGHENTGLRLGPLADTLVVLKLTYNNRIN